SAEYPLLNVGFPSGEKGFIFQICKKRYPMNSRPVTIDEYIAGFSGEVRVILNKIRSTVRDAAPEATETINYQIPTFTLNGNLVHFAAFKNHIGFYPTPSGMSAFAGELSAYKGAKGSVQFPLDQPIPYDLIARIVRFRVVENKQKSGKKK
ncbi:MAG TPA: DUF1801 domain-containing protein, partial [Saprospiraceae bacterium]|nr:DUF1801 domain-containing protein [Saprospiraceae bacterium]